MHSFDYIFSFKDNYLHEPEYESESLFIQNNFQQMIFSYISSILPNSNSNPKDVFIVYFSSIDSFNSSESPIIKILFEIKELFNSCSTSSEIIFSIDYISSEFNIIPFSDSIDSLTVNENNIGINFRLINSKNNTINFVYLTENAKEFFVYLLNKLNEINSTKNKKKLLQSKGKIEIFDEILDALCLESAYYSVAIIDETIENILTNKQTIINNI